MRKREDDAGQDCQHDLVPEELHESLQEVPPEEHLLEPGLNRDEDDGHHEEEQELPAGRLKRHLLSDDESVDQQLHHGDGQRRPNASADCRFVLE